MTRIFTLDQINKALPEVDAVAEIANGFKAYSRGLVEVPPVGELLFPEDDGEMHIKYGAVKGDEVFVVKIATGFFGNPALGLPPFGGCMLVLSQKTGMVLAVLLEEGELTNHRTAAAGAVAAKALAPSTMNRIGVVGSGVQARLQADYLRQITDCRSLAIWGRNRAKAEAAASDLAEFGFDVDVVDAIEELAQYCQLIVTTTPAEQPLLSADMIQPGTHITAMGSDTPHKMELAADLMARADVIVSDSIDQSHSRGEVFRSVESGAIDRANVVELGAVLNGDAEGRTSDEQITIADLTGVAVQDIKIAKAILDQMGDTE